MIPTISVGRYIGIQVTLLITFLIFVYSFTINKVYEWGTYDTTHYFMSLEADRVFESLDSLGTLPSPLNTSTQFFLDKSDLPESISKVFTQDQHSEGELLVAEVGGKTVYLLPNKIPGSNSFYYVTTQYDAMDDDYDVGVDISELQMMLAAVMLTILFFLVRNLAWSIISPIRILEKWASSVTGKTGKTNTLESLDLKFAELQSVAQRLNTALSTLEENNRKEKNFLQTLSHELRTPLAVTKAALELLHKDRNSLSEKQLKKIERMQRANDNMLSTSECLLWLWTRKEIEIKEETTNLYQLCQDTVESCQNLLVGKQVEVTVDISPEIDIQIERNLISMIVINLIRNAFQYTQRGHITISADSNRLSVANPYEPRSSRELDDMDSFVYSDYGYGVGLFLVNEICTQKNWNLSIDKQSSRYSVCVEFARRI